MKSIVLGIALITATTVGCANGQPAEPAAPQQPTLSPPAQSPQEPQTGAANTEPAAAAAVPAANQPASVDEALDRLDALGKALKDFKAAVTLTEIDNTSGSDTARNGNVIYQTTPDGNSRIRVSFLTKDEGTKRFDERIEYVLQNGVLIDRNYETKTEVRRQVLKPGEKANLLKLGEGPFPLPIGQDKAEVHRLFEVTQIPLTPDDPQNSVHLKLTPRPDTQFATKFTAIDVWVDDQTDFPVRIDAEDANQTSVRKTEFSDVQTNSGAADNDFKLEEVENWNMRTEEFAE
ncbi:MAG TPA: hypothetical protein VGN72_24310 [Tepidisphaeraceae bacterium]|jgi:outer membrane lipoprotein-sorting protein|nr:hypothetical protein [Tepidisphaeraceae bacterium]